MPTKESNAFLFLTDVHVPHTHTHTPQARRQAGGRATSDANMSLLLDRLLSVALADGGTGTLPPHAALDSPRRACVAILLRVPAPPTSLSQEAQQFDDLAALRRWLEAQPAPARPDAEVGWVGLEDF